MDCNRVNAILDFQQLLLKKHFSVKAMKIYWSSLFICKEINFSTFLPSIKYFNQSGNRLEILPKKSAKFQCQFYKKKNCGYSWWNFRELLENLRKVRFLWPKCLRISGKWKRLMFFELCSLNQKYDFNAVCQRNYLLWDWSLWYKNNKTFHNSFKSDHYLNFYKTAWQVFRIIVSGIWCFNT